MHTWPAMDFPAFSSTLMMLACCPFSVEFLRNPPRVRKMSTTENSYHTEVLYVQSLSVLRCGPRGAAGYIARTQTATQTESTRRCCINMYHVFMTSSVSVSLTNTSVFVHSEGRVKVIGQDRRELTRGQLRHSSQSLGSNNTKP